MEDYMHNSSKTKLAISDYLINVIHENPSIPTFLVKTDELNGFSIIYINDAATSIFQPSEQSSLIEVWNQIQSGSLHVSNKKYEFHQNVPLTILNNLYIYDISIILLQDGIETIYGVTMYDRTKNENEKNVLKGYKEKYLSLLNNNLDSVISVEESGNILDLNGVTSKAIRI